MTTQEMFTRMFNGVPLADLLAIERALIVTIEQKRKVMKPRKTPKTRTEGAGK
ncbi:MAG: hypothetical protein JXR40_06900 [Pontiellaceae bacterium]|nr:hypothetical protein [Pontiellaceae bacterium]